MRGIVAALAVIVAAVAQHSVAPMFDIGGTVVDLRLVVLALLVAFTGTGPALFAIPALAILGGLVSDRAILALAISYLPMLPLAYTLETDAPYVLPTFARMAVVVAAISVWVRLVSGLVLLAGGAAVGPVSLLTESIIPGLLIDTVAFLVGYGILRGVRLQPVSLPETEVMLR